MERTLIIFKPDCIKKKLEGKVLDIFLSKGFDLKACKMMKLDMDILIRHYNHLKDMPFFPGIVEFMTSDNVMVLVFEAENAISRARELLGPTDSKKAEKGTIRGDFGTDMRMNVCHPSDSVESAEREIANFFLPEEIF